MPGRGTRMQQAITNGLLLGVILSLAVHGIRFHIDTKARKAIFEKKQAADRMFVGAMAGLEHAKGMMMVGHHTNDMDMARSGMMQMLDLKRRFDGDADSPIRVGVMPILDTGQE